MRLLLFSFHMNRHARAYSDRMPGINELAKAFSNLMKKEQIQACVAIDRVALADAKSFHYALIMEPMEIFLRGVWTMVPDDEDTSWVRNRAKRAKDTGMCFPDQAEILKRMLDAGVSERDIARLCRIVGFETAQGILNMIDDPAVATYGLKDAGPELEWYIQVFDAESGDELERLDGVHEEFQSLDPNGREMEPLEEE